MFACEPGAVVASRYRLERQLGAGGMGEVWSAREVTTGEAVALKFLIDAEEEDTGARRRFMREARAASAVKHPHVVEMKDVLLENGEPIIVMELLEGETLAARLKRDKKLSIADTAAVLLPVVSAVGAAHAQGIIHRDLKPDNIFLSVGPNGHVVKVVDFGIAKLTVDAGDGEKTGGLTTTGTMLGTPYYMSPEQAFAEKDIDHRSDIWSLGIIAYRCVSGILPTRADNVGQILKIILSEKIPPLGAAAPGTPADVEALVRQMLSLDRAERPADLRAVAEVLARYTDVVTPSFAAAAPPSSASGPLPPTSDRHAIADALSEAETRRPSKRDRTKRSGATSEGARAVPQSSPTLSESVGAQMTDPTLRSPRRSIGTSIGMIAAALAVAAGVTFVVGRATVRSSSAAEGPPPADNAAIVGATEARGDERPTEAPMTPPPGEPDDRTAARGEARERAGEEPAGTSATDATEQRPAGTVNPRPVKGAAAPPSGAPAARARGAATPSREATPAPAATATTGPTKGNPVFVEVPPF